MAKPPKSPTNTNLAPARPAPFVAATPIEELPDGQLKAEGGSGGVDLTPQTERPIIHCATCFFGRSRIDNVRVCRGVPPTARFRSSQVIHGRGVRPLGDGIFPEVGDDDWCGSGTPDGWPVVRPAA